MRRRSAPALATGPGQASTRHRHFETIEIYVVLEGTGRSPSSATCSRCALDAVLVEPEKVRQPFNDTDSDQLWLVMGAPPEARQHAGDVRGDARDDVSGRTAGDAARTGRRNLRAPGDEG